MLELRGITKYYNPGTVNEMCLFQDFNLTVRKGEFVSVVGSNGSGKTSMLNILCGNEGIYEKPQDRTGVSEYCPWHLPIHDDPGKYVPGGQQREILWTWPWDS